MDLVHHKLYWRSTTQVEAGTSQLLAKGTKPYSLKVRSGTDLKFLLSRGQIRVNHGQRPFA
ncbi:MAG: hypothetical protein HY854_05900 [Burkholderiales bacterium]|nr:hypothetical protein [Burkholderiales bacterium]